MGTNTSDIIGFIGGAQTLVENFPMNILGMFRGKKYNSVMEFVIDVLRTLGVDDRALLRYLISKLFNTPTLNEVGSDIMNKISEMDLESDFINNMEDSTKTIISNILTAILSCSVIPEIANDKMDLIEGKKVDGFISVPLSLIDYSGMLNICPLDKMGKNYYNIENSDNFNVNTLYKSNDLNSFIWYSLNRGISIPQMEKNKMVWDNRYTLSKENYNPRNTKVRWDEWCASKKDGNGKLSLSGDNKLFPIMQLERENYFTNDGEKRLRVYISAQTYFRKGNFNKGIYKFNRDYLESIRILSTKMILTNIMQELLGGLFLSNPVNYSIEQTIIDAQINQIITNVLEAEDTQVSDCFFSFSNEDYDKMLQQAELLRYNAKILNSETAGAIEINTEDILKSLNEISSSASSEEKIETIYKTITDVAAIPAQDGSISISDKLALTYNNAWINEIVRSIVRPIVRSIMSPQVMLLLVINLETTGIIKLDNLTDKNFVMDLIRTKILAMVKSLIIYIKDKIVEILLNLFYEHIKPIINKYMAYIVMEQLEDWLRLLQDIKSNLPKYNLSMGIGLLQLLARKSKNAISVIDDVTYADIYTLEENNQNIPENTGLC